MLNVNVYGIEWFERVDYMYLIVIMFLFFCTHRSVDIDRKCILYDVWNQTSMCYDMRLMSSQNLCFK